MHQIKKLMHLFHLSLDDSYFHQSMLNYYAIDNDQQAFETMTSGRSGKVIFNWLDV